MRLPIKARKISLANSISLLQKLATLFMNNNNKKEKNHSHMKAFYIINVSFSVGIALNSLRMIVFTDEYYLPLIILDIRDIDTSYHPMSMQLHRGISVNERYHKTKKSLRLAAHCSVEWLPPLIIRVERNFDIVMLLNCLVEMCSVQ